MVLPRSLCVVALTGLFGSCAFAAPAARVVIAHAASDEGFKFDKVPPPATNDAATEAAFIIVSGERDGNGGELDKLHDGEIPASQDDPSGNFFFSGDGGRIAMDLRKPIWIERIGTYSWHTGERAPQTYKVYGAVGNEPGFVAKVEGDTDPTTVGWTLIADVDTRNEIGADGGQVGVAITGNGPSPIGKYRYLLFDVLKTDDGPFGNTFFSEIDVVDASGPKLEVVKVPEKILKQFKFGRYTFTVDLTKAPDLASWTEKTLMPVVEEWYPKIVEMLPSPGYRPPDEVTMKFRDDIGGTPAYAAGNEVTLNIEFFRNQRDREACGAVVHELVHVVQNYWWGRRRNRNAAEVPGWITEGIPDYIRWFLFEPQSKGAEITKQNFEEARYDSSYRVSGNFLDWVVRTKDSDLIRKLNAAAREGKYSPDDWKKWTGSTVEELGEEWRKENAKRLRIDYQPST